MFDIRTIVLAATLAAASLAAADVSTDYTYEIIVHPDDGWSQIYMPVINEQGQLGFHGVGPEGSGMFVWDPVDGMTLVFTAAPGFIPLVYDIDESGRYTFSQWFDAVYVGDATSGSAIIADTASPLNGFFGGAHSNGAGLIAFQADIDTGGDGVYVADPNDPPNTFTPIVDAAAGFTFIGPSVLIDDAENVIFYGVVGGQYVLGRGNTSSAVNDYDVLLDSSGDIAFWGNEIDLNSSYDIFADVTKDNGTRGMFLYSGGSETLVAQLNQDDWGGNFYQPNINDCGDIVFSASRLSYGHARRGTFVGGDAANDGLIEPGDTFAGGTVFDTGVIIEGMNNKGQIGFVFILEDNTRGIAVATPVGASCAGDINGDGVVDTADVLLMLAAWGPVDACSNADLNGDGVVDTSDILALLASWGRCP